MAYEFKLPDIGEGVVEGEIVRWLVNEGDVLMQDQPMVEIMTDKATVEIPAPKPGKVLTRHYAEGGICPVGKVLITIDDGAAAVVPAAQVERIRRASAPASSVGVAPAVAAPVVAAAPPPSAPVLATPATRKLAREMGVNISSVRGSGPAGRITHEDVRGAQAGGSRKRAATPRPPRVSDSPDDVRVPFRGLRRKIAERMALSKQKAAHFTYVEEVDATALVTFRTRANARLASQGQKLSFLPFIVKATVEALKHFPQINATLDEATSEIVQRRSYHIGIASATTEGLMVPVLRDADKLSLIDLGKEVDRLASVTKSGKATLHDLTGSTFTITSLGTLGGLFATPVINFPEVAILAVHKIEKRPVVVDDKIEIREMVNLSISVDHRLVDGHEAAAFVAMIKESLETPGLLFLDSV